FFCFAHHLKTERCWVLVSSSFNGVAHWLHTLVGELTRVCFRHCRQTARRQSAVIRIQPIRNHRKETNSVLGSPRAFQRVCFQVEHFVSTRIRILRNRFLQ